MEIPRRYGIGVWKAPFFREAFPNYLEQFSVANAFVISGGGVMSSILGGNPHLLSSILGGTGIPRL